MPIAHSKKRAMSTESINMHDRSNYQPNQDISRVIQHLQNQMNQGGQMGLNLRGITIPSTPSSSYPVQQPQYGYGVIVDSPAPTRQMIQKMSQSSYTTHGMDAIPSQSVNFKLFEHPEEHQRKAYKNENRYILPNPLVIMQVKPEGVDMDCMPVLKDCEVSVRLVYLNGEELENDKQGILEGTKHKPMVGSENEKKAEFSLKIQATSGKSKFRLCFTATYTCEGIKYKEIIFSNSFKVISNKKKTTGTTTVNPLLIDLIPRSGYATEETELWVRGCYFQDKQTTVVKIGDKQAKIIEIEDNLIVCQVPPRSDIQCETEVVVTVTNTAPQTGQNFESTKKLNFRYVPHSSSYGISSDSRPIGSKGVEDQTDFADNPIYSGHQQPPVEAPTAADPFMEWTSSHDAFFRVLGTTKAPQPEDLLDLVYPDQHVGYSHDPFNQRTY